MLAAREGYTKVINLLVSHGAELDSQDSMGFTVSHKHKRLLLAAADGGAGSVLCCFGRIRTASQNPIYFLFISLFFFGQPRLKPDGSFAV